MSRWPMPWLSRCARRAVVVAARPTRDSSSSTALPHRRIRGDRRMSREPTGCASRARHICSSPAVAAGASRFVAARSASSSPRGAAGERSGDAAADAVRSMESPWRHATSVARLTGRHPPLRHVVRVRGAVNRRHTMTPGSECWRLPVVVATRGSCRSFTSTRTRRQRDGARALDLAPAGARDDIVDDRAVSLVIVETTASYTGFLLRRSGCPAGCSGSSRPHCAG